MEEDQVAMEAGQVVMDSDQNTDMAVLMVKCHSDYKK